MNYVTLLNDYFNRVLENGVVSTLYSTNLKELPEPVRYVIYCVSSTAVKRLTYCTGLNIRALWVSLLGELDYKYLYNDMLPKDIQKCVLSQKFRENLCWAIFRRYILTFSIYRKWKHVWNKYFFQDYWSAYECFEYFVLYNLCYPSKTAVQILQLISYEIGFHNQNIEQVKFLIAMILDVLLRNDYSLYDIVRSELMFSENCVFALTFTRIIEFLVRFNNFKIKDLNIPKVVLDCGYTREIVLVLQEYF